MNVHELADELEGINDGIELEYNRFSQIDNAATMLRQQADRIAELEKFIKAILKKGGCDGNICKRYDTHPVKQLEDGYFLPMNVLNEPMQKSIKALIDHAKKGRWSNAIVRQDGVETTYEADWIKSLVPVFHPVKQLSDEEIMEVFDACLFNGGFNTIEFARAIIKEITE